MADLKDDLAFVREFIDACAPPDFDEPRMTLALDRIASAVGELEHLREAARLMFASHELGLVRDTAYGAALDRWLEAERARKAAAERGKAGER